MRNFRLMFSTVSVRSFLLLFVIVFALYFPVLGFSQTLGGSAAYNFLKLPSSPLLAAFGGVNASYINGEVGFAANNPALLRQQLDQQLAVGFNSFLAATKAFSLSGAAYSKKLQTTFGGHVSFLDYGSIPNTDASGNQMGNFHPVDYTVQASAAKAYLQRWNYGVTIKFIHSSYGIYRSSGLALDIGILYRDSANGLSASVLIKNMGTQLRNYAGETEELPFDFQAGVTKRLAKAPFGFSLTAQQLQTFNILYNDTTFNRDNNTTSSTSGIAKVFTHLVLATHIYLSQNIEAHVGYNVLRRNELSVVEGGNGLTGFSAGLRVQFSKLQIMYSRSAYQRGVASNQIGITLLLDRLFGLGK